MNLTLRTIPDSILRTKSKVVSAFDAGLIVKTQEMLKIMYQSEGIGLAGPQAGLSERIVVMDLSDNRNMPQIFINPIINQAYGEIKSEEGCLSIPKFRSVVMRSENILVSYQDTNGKEYKQEAGELLSRCFQHEIDHLDGILFTDHLKGLNKKLYQRWEKKYFDRLQSEER